MRCSTTSDEKYEGVLDNVLQQLYTSDSAKLATTCAALAMLISQAPQNIESLSSKVLPEATRLLHSEHPLVQQNACAIVMTLAETQAQELSSGMQAWSEAVDWISSQLSNTAGPTDLKVNCVEALGAIASANQDGAALLQQRGYEALITTLEQDSSTLQEAAADALCKIASSQQTRPQLVDKGALQGLTAALQSSSHEVQVRSLLALGMLVGDNSQWQIQLAEVQGALQSLLELRLQHADADVQSISDGIVGALDTTSVQCILQKRVTHAAEEPRLQAAAQQGLQVAARQTAKRKAVCVSSWRATGDSCQQQAITGPTDTYVGMNRHDLDLT